MMLLVSGATKTVRRILTNKPQTMQWLGSLITPHSGNSIESVLNLGCSWAADNAAFSNWCESSWLSMLDRISKKPRLLWATIPDVVGDAKETLALFEKYAPKMSHLPRAFVAQDGAEVAGVPWDSIDCLFIGGTTEWKLGGLALSLVEQAKKKSKLVHMGRVNTLRRLRLAKAWGCDSIDGTSMSMFRRPLH